MRPATRLAAGSLGIGVAVLGLKTAAWLATGSVALLSDALESCVNLATAAAAFAAVRVAARPADAGHPYGHAKAEYLSAVAVGVLIVVAAFVILSQAWSAAFDAQRTVVLTWPALAATGAATAINVAWARRLLAGGKRAGSAALVADARHLMADVMTSAGVLAGVAMAWITGLWWLDPVLAALVAVSVLVAGWQVIRDSVGGLLDEAAPPETQERIRLAIAETAVGAVQAHDLRTRRDGRGLVVDFHLIVPGTMSVTEAHDICDRIEARIRRELGPANVTIHVEPETKAKTDAIDVP